jgi:hypothetical protein
MLKRDDIAVLLDELASELEAEGVHGDLFLVDGAMALAYSTRRATRDLDAIFEPKQVIYRAAQRVGDRRGLPPDWLNDGVKGRSRWTDRVQVADHLARVVRRPRPGSPAGWLHRRPTRRMPITDGFGGCAGPVLGQLLPRGTVRTCS